MLITMIQMGKLDMPGYISQVKKAISETKDVALVFKKHNRLDLAKIAIVRIKIMTDEVNEVEST